MPTVLILLVLIGVFYTFWLFFQTATPYQTGRLLGIIAIILAGIALLYLALTGRLPWALGALIALWPLLAAYFNRRRQDILRAHQRLNDADGTLKEQMKDDFQNRS